MIELQNITMFQTHFPGAHSNRRDVLKSSAFLTGGLAVAGFPKQLFAASSTTTFNSNIASAFFTAFKTFVTAYNQGKVATAQADNVASTFATFIAEMNSTGMVAQTQNYITANAAQIQAVTASSITPNAVLSLADQLATFTYAEAQTLAEALAANLPQVKQTLLQSNSVWNTLEGMESGFQQIAAYISSIGGTLNVSGRRGQAHLLEVYCMARYVGFAFSAVALGLALVPGGIVLDFGIATIGANFFFGSIGFGLGIGGAIGC